MVAKMLSLSTGSNTSHVTLATLLLSPKSQLLAIKVVFHSWEVVEILCAVAARTCTR